MYTPVEGCQLLLLESHYLIVFIEINDLRKWRKDSA